VNGDEEEIKEEKKGERKRKRTEVKSSDLANSREKNFCDNSTLNEFSCRICAPLIMRGQKSEVGELDPKERNVEAEKKRSKRVDSKSRNLEKKKKKRKLKTLSFVLLITDVR
jgi:hypothetical protein